MGKGLQGSVECLSVFDDGSGSALYVAGNFTTTGGAAGGNLLRWNGSSWSDLDGWAGYVNDLAVFDDGSGPALYAGGDFDVVGGALADHIARWDGSSWSALGSGTDDWIDALVVHDDGSGPALYAGGSFTSAGGIPAKNVARWDGSSWSALGSGIGGGVFALAVFDDGGGPALYAAGSFNKVGGSPMAKIAKWNGSSWSKLGSGLSSTVYALTTLDLGGGPALYAGGNFKIAGGVSALAVAKWDGSSWSSLGVGPANGVNGDIYALHGHDDGSGPALYVGGTIITAGGLATDGVARWDGADWSTLGNGLGGSVYDLADYDDGHGRALYAGGSFSGTPPGGDGDLAKWGCACTGELVTYCTSSTTTHGCVPSISGAGTPSSSAASGFDVAIASVEGHNTGLFLYGASGSKAFPWGSGFLCVKAPSQRTELQDSGGTSNQCDGALALDFNAYMATHPGSLGAPFTAGQTFWMQGWFRDPASPKGTNFSDALQFTTCP